MHEEIAGDETGELADRVSFDGSVAGERLRRMQTARGRELKQTLELLMKMRKGENNGQTASDRGKMNEDEKAATVPETPAPVVAASCEKQHEPRSASNPASRKRYKSERRRLLTVEGCLPDMWP